VGRKARLNQDAANDTESSPVSADYKSGHDTNASAEYFSQMPEESRSLGFRPGLVAVS
jgi:hypothetical protein